jgi:endoglucanase
MNDGLTFEQARERYLVENPDVAAAGMDPWDHFVRHGEAEGRAWKGGRMTFKGAREQYLADYPDVAAAAMDPWDHYVRHGKAEGRVWKGETTPPHISGAQASSVGVVENNYSAREGKLFFGGSEVKIRGINWFGLNTGTHCVHSLWSTGLAEYISVLKNSGFNAVRLVLSAKVMLNLNSLAVNSVSEALNPGMSGMTVGQHLDDLVSRLGRAGILVMLNLHRMSGEGDNAEDIGPYWYSEEYPEDRIIDAWVAIAKRYATAVNVFAMDIKNEPHGATWGTGDASTDFAAFCERVGNAILAVNPRVLIGVAGVTKCVWSDCVGPAVARPVKLSAPDKVFYTPHFYNVYKWWPNVDFTAYMDECVGNVVRAGLPVIVGEWGYNEGESSDMRWLADFTAYLNAVGIENCMYWALNENAGDNQSILAPGSANVKESKIDVIKRVTPWASSLSF